MDNRHFTLMVVGDKPHKLAERYDDHEVEPYVVYEFAKRDELFNNALKVYKEAARQCSDKPQMREYFDEMVKKIEDLGPYEYYVGLSEEYDLDDDGNAISTVNKDKKYDYCHAAKHFALPMFTKDGKETFSARKGDIDWGKTRRSDDRAYKAAWEMVMEGRIPLTNNEREIYENMRNRKAYFAAYGDKDTYVASNTSFWTFAYLDKDGWTEVGNDQFRWTIDFFDKFIKPLPDDALITIFECIRYE